MAHPVSYDGHTNRGFRMAEPTHPGNNNNYKTRQEPRSGDVRLDDVILSTHAGSADNISTITRVSGDDAIVCAPGSTLTRKDKINIYQDFKSWEKSTANRYRERHSTWLRIWNGTCVVLVAYLLGVVAFVTCFHVKVLPRLPFPVITNLEDWNPAVTPFVWWEQGAILVEVMWGYVHLRKTALIILSSARLKTGTTHSQPHEFLPAHNSHRSRVLQRFLGAGTVLYHIFFGAWLGWANNVFCGYLPSDMEFVITGLAIFGAGELAIIVGELFFICRRQTETKSFRYVRRVAELFTWTGFALVSLTFPAVLVFLARFAILAFFIYIPERPGCFCT